MINNEVLLLAKEIKELYVTLRRKGNNRRDSLQIVQDYFRKEIEDHDDRFPVLLGLAMALCARNELTLDISNELRNEINSIRNVPFYGQVSTSYLDFWINKLDDPTYYGEEATYKKRPPYIPDWNIGDTFVHTLTHPSSKSLGIHGWSIIFHKVGDHIDDTEKHRHLFYVSLCPPGKEPRSASELQKLGFLPMMRRDNATEYLAQITVTSKKAMASYELEKIGIFYHVLPPKDSAEENPLVTMPLFGHIRKGDMRPDYEAIICSLYRTHSKSKKGTNLFYHP